MNIKFRTETAYGEGGCTPAEILAYECIELQNTWILDELASRLSQFSYSDTEEHHDMVEKMREKNVDEYESYTDMIPFMHDVLDAFSEVLGYDINYLLWLTDYNTVIDEEDGYGFNIDDDVDDVDAYETGFLLINVEGDGNLYAYHKQPLPLNKSYVIREKKKLKKKR